MSRLEENTQKIKIALDRVTGCDLSHLSLTEAKLIQVVRDLNLDPALLMQELKSGLSPAQTVQIESLKPGETATVNGQVFGRGKDWKA